MPEGVGVGFGARDRAPSLAVNAGLDAEGASVLSEEVLPRLPRLRVLEVELGEDVDNDGQRAFANALVRLIVTQSPTNEHPGRQQPQRLCVWGRPNPGMAWPLPLAQVLHNTALGTLDITAQYKGLSLCTTLALSLSDMAELECLHVCFTDDHDSHDDKSYSALAAFASVVACIGLGRKLGKLRKLSVVRLWGSCGEQGDEIMKSAWGQLGASGVRLVA